MTQGNVFNWQTAFFFLLCYISYLATSLIFKFEKQALPLCIWIWRILIQDNPHPSLFACLALCFPKASSSASAALVGYTRCSLLISCNTWYKGPVTCRLTPFPLILDPGYHRHTQHVSSLRCDGEARVWPKDKKPRWPRCRLTGHEVGCNSFHGGYDRGVGSMIRKATDKVWCGYWRPLEKN